MAAKYKEMYDLMVSEHPEEFEAFGVVHEKYDGDQKKYQAELNEVGDPVLELIQKYESRLCRKSERSGYGSYSGGLSEKFWAEVRKNWKHIDQVGVVVG